MTLTDTSDLTATPTDTETTTPRPRHRAFASFDVAPAELSTFLANMLTVASKDRVRPVLCSVNITVADGSLIGEATDSYMLIRQEVTVSHEGSGTFLVSREALEAVVKMVKGYKGSTVSVRFAPDLLTVSTVDAEASWPIRDLGDFPNTAQLWPTGDPVATPALGLGSSIMAKLSKIVDPNAGKGHEVARFEFFGALKPCRARFGESITVLVMPARIS